MNTKIIINPSIESNCSGRRISLVSQPVVRRAFACSRKSPCRAKTPITLNYQPR